MTGDVLGASAELATTAALVAAVACRLIGLPQRAKATRLLLVRHAEPDESLRGRCYGSLDVAPRQPPAVRRRPPSVGAAAGPRRRGRLHEPASSARSRPRAPVATAHGLEADSPRQPARARLRRGGGAALRRDRGRLPASSTASGWRIRRSVRFPGGEELADLRERVLPEVAEIRGAARGGGGRGRRPRRRRSGRARRRRSAFPDAAFFRLDQAYGGVSVVDWIDGVPVVRVVSSRPILARMTGSRQRRRPHGRKRDRLRATSRTRTRPGSPGGSAELGSRGEAARGACATRWTRSRPSCARGPTTPTWSSSPAGSAERLTTSRARAWRRRSASRRRRSPSSPAAFASASASAASATTRPAGPASRAARRALENPLGGAPGFVVANVYVLPGLPSEMRRCSRRSPTASAASRSARGAAGIRRARARSSPCSRRRRAAHPAVMVGSYPSFLDSGPEVEVVLKSADADALGEAAAWLEAALDRRIGGLTCGSSSSATWRASPAS